MSLSPNVSPPYQPFLYFTRDIETSRVGPPEVFRFLDRMVVEVHENKEYEHVQYEHKTVEELWSVAIDSEDFSDVVEARRWVVGWSESDYAREESWCPLFNNAGARWFWDAELLTIHCRSTNRIYVYKYELFVEA